MMPMEVREVREARPVTMETMSSSWVMEFWGKGGILVLTGVRAMGRGTWEGERHHQLGLLYIHLTKNKQAKQLFRKHWFTSPGTEW